LRPVSRDIARLQLKRMKIDKPAYLFDQLNWLKEIGYIDVDCFYKYFNFAVFSGQKPATR